MPKIKVITLLETIFKNKGKGSELWKAISELLQTREQEISVFCSYIKHKINSYDKENSLLAMDLVDFCVDYGQMELWSHLASKDFLTSLTTNLKTRNDIEIQSKLLFLIEKWANKFSNYADLSNFQSIYSLLKRKNVQFPTNIQSNYKQYVKYNIQSNKNISDFTNNRPNNYYYNNNNNNNVNNNSKETDPETYLRDINLDLNTSSYEKKYKRLVNKLYDWTHDIHEINVLINKNINGINNNKISGLIKDLSKGNKQLIETIESGKLKDETLMKISLNVNSDIDMTIKRWSNHKKGISPNPFISSFFQDEQKQQNDNNYNLSNATIIKSNFNNFNNNNYINSNKTIYDINNFYNINNSNINFNQNNNGNMNNNMNNNNKNSFNLLIDFECAPVPNNQNNNLNNLSLNLNDNNNMKNFFNLVSQTEKQNQLLVNNNNYNQNNNYNNININNIKTNNFNSMNNFMNINNNISYNNNINNNKSMNNNENNELNNNNNDNRQSIMYPSFEELNED